MNDGSPAIVVSLLPARSAEPPQSSGSTGASALRTLPEADRVATGPSAGENDGSEAAHPAGRARVERRSSSAERAGLAADHLARLSSHAALANLPRSATSRALATASSSTGNATAGSKPRISLVAATSAAPKAEPCAAPVFCLVGAGQPMIVDSPMIDGAPT